MPRRLMAVLLLAAVLLPGSALAQSPIVFSSLQVQLWPEYDQPSMLVIYDFQLAPEIQLPVGVTVQFPDDSNLVAVAVEGAGGTLLNADYLESSASSDWRSVIVQVESPAIYRIEYYQPLERSGQQRQFTYEWPGQYAVQNFGIGVRLPADAMAASTLPQLQTGQSDGSTRFLERDFGALGAGSPFTLALNYTRTSDALAASEQDLQPSQPLDASTPGRVMLSNYLPYILGILGVILMGGGAVYFWQSSRIRPAVRGRHRGDAQSRGERAGDVHCHQCGTRSQAGDRFCRVCGTRLRQPE